jgi:3-oxoacyl-[acyl-carrier-protein] synthase-3
MTYAVINGTGSYLPSRSMSNYDFETQMDTSHEWIVTRTGITSRFIASAEETTSYMASKAALNALESSSISADDIDLIIAATCTPDNFFPGVACAVQETLKITKPIPAFDISAACSGYIYALDIAKQYISSGAARNVLVIGSESMSRGLDWKDRSTCILFGDGAGACILSASDNPGIIKSILHASFDKQSFLSFPNDSYCGGSSQVSMQGNEVFKIAVKYMGEIVDEILKASNLNREDIDWLVPHQANIRIIQAIAKKLDLPLEKVIITLENQGNTSAASIPLALDHAIKQNKVKRGDLLLLEAFGGGMTWGAALVRY